MNWIFFDLDDTLFDFSKSSIISLRRLWEEEDCIRIKFDSAEEFIDEYHIHNSKMWELHESGIISSEFLKEERFRLTIAPDTDTEEIRKISGMLNDRYLFLLGECPYFRDGAIETLQRLSSRYLIGVLTNGFTEVQYRKLRSTGLDRFIQRMIISDEIGVQKPDARLFRYAERETGASPGNIIMVGDNPLNDIQGALNAGWHAIYYDWKAKPFETGSGLYLGKTNNLPDILTMLP